MAQAFNFSDREDLERNRCLDPKVDAANDAQYSRDMQAKYGERWLNDRRGCEADNMAEHPMGLGFNGPLKEAKQ